MAYQLKVVKCGMNSQIATGMAYQAEIQGADERFGLKDYFMIKSHQDLWQMVKFEVDATLRKVYDLVLQDRTVDSTERFLRAEGLLLLGGTYASNSDIPENENATVQLK